MVRVTYTLIEVRVTYTPIMVRVTYAKNSSWIDTNDIEIELKKCVNILTSTHVAIIKTRQESGMGYLFSFSHNVESLNKSVTRGLP